MSEANMLMEATSCGAPSDNAYSGDTRNEQPSN